jgi:hypothetical protein
MATEAEAAVLARYARSCIAAKLGHPAATAPQGEPYDVPGATFVSLHWPDGRLQGCIGTLAPRRTLAADVAHHACAAAFDDPRARPLDAGDVDALTIEVSVLTPLEPVAVSGEIEARAALRPGRDGVVLSWQGHRATFIPQMWAQLPDAATLLAELKRKAGLPADFWAPDVVLERYAVVAATDPPHAALAGGSP